MNTLFNTKNNCKNISKCNIADLPKNFLSYYNEDFYVFLNLNIIVIRLEHVLVNFINT